MLTVKKGKEETTIKDRAAEAALIGFVETKAEIDSLNALLKEHKEQLVQTANALLEGDEAQTITFGVDDDRVKVTFGYDIKVADEVALETLLGDRFTDLVKVQVSYKPEAKLKEMALEDDALRDCLTIRDKAPAVAVVK